MIPVTSGPYGRDHAMSGNEMADNTGIEWTEATWNPTTGCDRVSPGCDNCYALTLAKRLKAMGSEKYQEDGEPRTSGPGFKLPFILACSISRSPGDSLGSCSSIR